MLKQALAKVNLLHPEFVVSVGDLINGFTDNPGEITAQWEEFEGFIAELDMPFFYTPGNHDWSNPEMARIWQERYGASTYHFAYKDVLFLVLNTEEMEPGGLKPGLTPAQLDYARKALAAHPNARWTFVLMHQPLWALRGAPGWSELEALFASRRHTMLAGHMHVYDYQQSADGHDRITLGTTGGYSLLRGKLKGEFDHVTWVTMTKDGPKLANLELSGIDDKFVIPPAVRQAYERAPVFAFSPWIAGGTRQAVALPVTITNNFAHPLAFRLEALASPDITLAAEAPAGVVPAGETRQITLNLTPSASASPRPLIVRAEAELTLEPGNTIAWREAARLAPVRVETLPRAAQPIVFDGAIGEWGALRFAGGSEGVFDDGQRVRIEAADASYRFDVRRDDQHVYVALDVTDDEVATAALTDPHNRRDFAAISFDARPASISAGNAGQIAEVKQGKWLFMMVTPNESDGELLFGGMIPPAFGAKLRPHAKGYTAEFRIPVAYIERMQGPGWRDLRLNVGINDYDPKTRSRAPVLMNWQETWERAVLGSGLFARSEETFVAAAKE